MTAANDNARAASPRDPARDIGALARSGHVEAGGALPITQRVQTSGRGDPQLPRWTAEGERAQRILGRAYAEGGLARRYALALWLEHGYAEKSTPLLAIALGVLLRTESERHATLKYWTKFGGTESCNALLRAADRFMRDANAWYETADEEAGHAGVFGRLFNDADGVRGDGGVVERLREWHRGWLADRAVHGDCQPLSKHRRCSSVEAEARCSVHDGITGLSLLVGPPSSRRCAEGENDCGCEWDNVCSLRVVVGESDAPSAGRKGAVK